MNLIDKIKALATLEGIKDSEIIWDEVDFFLKEHKGHGTHELTLAYEEDGSLVGIRLQCRPVDLTDKDPLCLHEERVGVVHPAFFYSLIYNESEHWVKNMQKLLRENKIGPYLLKE